MPAFSASEIEAVGSHRTYSVPIERVWPACLEIVTQYGAVLAAHDSGKEHTLVVMCGLHNNQAAGGDGSPTVMGMYYDRWLAFSVAEREPGRTVVSSATISSSLNLQPSEGAGDKFLYHLGTQLGGEARWLPNYQIDWSRVRSRDVRVALPDDVSDDDEDLEQRVGTWVSRRLRDNAVIIECRELDQVLEEIVRRIKVASGAQQMEVNVHVIASPEMHAFALPNGDVFIYSGLLDMMDSTDALAVVLAHEIDHLNQHDVIHRLNTLMGGRKEGVFTAAVSVVVGTAIGVQYAGSTMGDIAQLTVQNLGTLGAAHLGSTMVSNYSQDAELRADRNGASIAHAAGFDTDLFVELLAGLHKLDTEARTRGDLVISNLVNKAPGLEFRIAAMKSTVVRLRDGSFDPNESIVVPEIEKEH